tara:strand:- start:4601 stop:6151 length:1551 start_codon:yes stop_codon:yes gene_type:complete
MKNNENFSFKDLFVFDLANNHQGDLDHAKNIIKEVSELTNKENLNGAIKFQFRELSTFIHKGSRTNKENKHIERFLSTELSKKKFEELANYAKKQSIKRICTPFDEASVDFIKELNLEAIKIASCSSKDWPLIEKIANAGLPIIFSTGGLKIDDIDNLVSFLDHRACNFSIMHCVSIYPTRKEDCNLVQISVLKNRYPEKVIGWSTHEDPNNLQAVQMGYALGARMFERHVGISNSKYKLNAYSSNPTQLSNWIESYKEGKNMYGVEERISSKIELKSIESLSRGVYVKNSIKKGEIIKPENVYFAMPILDGQLSSGEFKKGIICNNEIKTDCAVLNESIQMPATPDMQTVKTAIHEIRAMLNKAHIKLGPEFEIEISHHYGLKKFRETGALIITCINREYCKKLLVVLPGQNHPNHYHKLKEETFQVLSGSLDIVVDGHERKLYPGDCCLVQPGVFHSFSSTDGCIVEEVSTTHFKEDSYYQDNYINTLETYERKTKVDHWGRFQMLIKEKIETY